MSARKQRDDRAEPAAAPLSERAYTSREAARVSGVPFFTVDYWDRSKFLRPSIAKGEGRGKGRQRMYSYGDIILLRIARELREQKVSLETLRSIVRRLASCTGELATARYVIVGREIETARTSPEMMKILRRPGRRTFGVLLDLRALLETVREKARALEQKSGKA
ncbi:MAG TPA: MerR family transcriptional regulator [Thermoanaerobaculia bacterium]|jgi:DNA-binding transcriptional MerR regulator